MQLGARVLNQETPHGHVPLRPMGRIPVIARLVTADGTELRPAVAIRWTRTHVMVCVEEHRDRKVASDYLWLRAADVVRLFRIR